VSDRPAAVVIGMDCTTGLQTARVLARHGVPVIGMAADRGHPCCRTRVCRDIVTADITGPGLVEALLEIGRGLDARAVLFPCTDLSVLLLSRRRAELEPWFHLVLPAPETIEMLIDKGRFSSWAEREGLPVPRTRLVRTADEMEAAARVLRFPCMLKPGVKTREWKRHTRAKAFRVDDAAALRSRFAECAGWADTLVVQEFVEGGDDSHFTCNCYFSRSGEPLVTFTSRKLRQWPITGGEGCLSEEVRDDAVRAETLRLFSRAGHRGLGYVEIKRDSRTGEYLIIEPNVGRPTGRSAQADAAGVELLFTQYCDALGLPLPDAREQRYSRLKWIHTRRDFQSAAYHWIRGELTVREWARSRRGPKVDALFSWTDPVPFWADLLYAAWSPVRRPERRAISPTAPAAAVP
jgi:predicted ATP-grasp superfamily ATP-dependent carboligase